MSVRIIQGDALASLRELPDDSVHCCITSPPYWALRSYLPTDHPDKGLELGSEPTPDAWAARLVEVFREVRRVLRPDGTCFVNVGDSYAQQTLRSRTPGNGTMVRPEYIDNNFSTCVSGLKPKDLIGQPWLLAFALRADGWYLRGDYIWAKPSPMPESVTDRCTKSHEYIFHFSKSARYFWDQEATREGWADSRNGDPVAARTSITDTLASGSRRYDHPTAPQTSGRNLRSVWTIASELLGNMEIDGKEVGHFAAFPSELVRRCILAGTSQRGCCPACGSPWQRVVEREAPPDYGLGTSPKNRGQIGQQQRNALGPPGNGLGVTPSTTLGWRQTCTCPPADPVPCTVLDPFGGSGTVGVVADKLDRNAILIELSEDYAKMAEKRIAKARSRRMLGDFKPEPVVPGQIALPL